MDLATLDTRDGRETTLSRQRETGTAALSEIWGDV
jgi:hypothetical protein